MPPIPSSSFIISVISTVVGTTPSWMIVLCVPFISRGVAYPIQGLIRVSSWSSLFILSLLSLSFSSNAKTSSTYLSACSLSNFFKSLALINRLVLKRGSLAGSYLSKNWSAESARFNFASISAALAWLSSKLTKSPIDCSCSLSF